MAKRNFVQDNFLAILAFGVMFLSVFVALTAANTQTSPVSFAQGNGGR